MANHNPLDLLAVAVFTVAAVAVLLFSAGLRALLPLFGLPLVFVLPGYALTALLFPKREFGYAELLGYSLGLSLAIDILGGLVLNLTTQGLALTSWTLWLGGVTLCSVIIAAWRRPPERRPWMPLRLNLSVAQGLMLGLSVLIAVIAVMIASQWATPPSNFTELWILPTQNANTVQFGVRNLEPADVAYKLEVQVGNSSVYNVSLDLQPGETWARSMILGSPQEAVQVLLYRRDDPTQVYRQVGLKGSHN